MNDSIQYLVNIRLLRNGEDRKTSFGLGTAYLLKGIEQTGSLNQSAKSMGMAYSKAWKALKETEKHLGFLLIERKGPGGSILTDKGRQFLAMYDKMQRSANQAVQEILDQHKSSFPKDTLHY
jgi:molybdate transport system regulatory protein